MKSVRFAACQFPVSGCIKSNRDYIVDIAKDAAGNGCDIVHFPETALSGYAGVDFSSLTGFDWSSLSMYTRDIMTWAEKLGIWIILGSCRQTGRMSRPRNSLHIISPSGNILATYDKRKLYGREKVYYSKGRNPLVLTLNGVKCGFLICYDSCFPRLYESYRKRGVQLLFHSYYNARNINGATSLDDLILAQLRTRAADNGMWISASNSSERHSRLPACIARPDGSIVACEQHKPGFVVHELPDKYLGWTYDNRAGRH